MCNYFKVSPFLHLFPILLLFLVSKLSSLVSLPSGEDLSSVVFVTRLVLSISDVSIGTLSACIFSAASDTSAPIFSSSISVSSCDSFSISVGD